MEVVIVNYGLGNLWSVKNAFNYMGANVIISDNPEIIASASKLVLPGVGSFGTGMENLIKLNLIKPLNWAVLENKIPILGICLGMQLLGNESEEAPGIKGLGWIPGYVKKFKTKSMRLPHMGFNSVKITHINPLFRENIKTSNDFYFVHSYFFKPRIKFHSIAQSHYGEEFTAVINKENIFGVQFHPEKSQSNGLELISYFLKYSGE